MEAQNGIVYRSFLGFVSFTGNVFCVVLVCKLAYINLRENTSSVTDWESARCYVNAVYSRFRHFLGTHMRHAHYS